MSSARMLTYEKATTDDNHALALYQWNAEISGEFLPILQICEVTIRNSISEAIEKVYGVNWPWNKTFFYSLPNTKHGYNARKDLTIIIDKFTTVGKIIPELKFYFWQKMMTSRHDSRIWDLHFDQTFPNMGLPQKTISQKRKIIFDNLEKIRIFRNRIAHHEPIFNRPLNDDYKTIESIVSFRCSTTSDWLKNIEKVKEKITNKP